MVARAALVLSACLLVSCTSIFDSYFPETTEFLDLQTDLAAEVGDSGIASVSLGYLQATDIHSKDYVVVLVGTKNGGNEVLFYSTDLELLKSYNQSKLTAMEGGNIPILGLFGQDGSLVYTGDLGFNAQSLKPISGGFLAPYFTGNPQLLDLSTYRVTSGGSELPALFYAQGTTLNVVIAANYSGLSSVGGVTLGDGTGSVRFMDAAYWKGTYYAVAMSPTQGYFFMTAPSADSSLLTSSYGGTHPVTPESYSEEGGWATARGAVVMSHSDNATLLTAYSWKGEEKGRLRLSDDEQIFALVFAPSGKAWYLFESSTGKLSRQRPWW